MLRPWLSIAGRAVGFLSSFVLGQLEGEMMKSNETPNHRIASGHTFCARCALLLGLSLFVFVSCRRSQIGGGTSQKPAQEQPRPAAVPAVTPVVARDPLPPDGQVMRDLERRANCEARQLQERIKNLTIKSKQLDPYEKDECNVIAEGKLTMSGERIRYTLVYQSRGNFWKLRGIDSRSVHGGYTIADCP